MIGISAQEISVKSFRLLPEDLSARVNPVKNDNAQTCALVRIVTTERGFEFDPDALGMCKSVDETHAGEVWIWLAPGSRRLTIRHSALGVLRNYEYPVAIECACTYEMVLVTGRITTIVEEQNKANFVAITFLPQNAQLKIDNAPVATRDGSYAHTLPVGKHTYELLCPMYHTLSGEFQILPDSTTSINVALQPNFGQLAVYSEPESGADVFINGEKKGVTPYTSSQLQSGFCQVQVVKNMFQPAEQQVEIRDGDTAVVRLTMQPNFGEPELVCADSATEIWIDGVRFGAGRWSGRLEAGIHLVELRKPSHRVVSQSIEVKNGERRSISLPPPTPIYGQVSVNVLPLGADILLDGKIVGQTPKMLDHILIGEHRLSVQMENYEGLTRDVHVTEREVSVVEGELRAAKKRDVSVEQVVKQNDTIKSKQRAPMGIFFTLNAACSTAPQWSGGLRVGTTRKWGWNVSLMTNFNMKAAKAELPEAGTQYAFAAKKSSRLSATAGPVWHPDPHVLLFLNAGYGYRGVCYQALADGEFYRYQNGTLQGAECSLGVMLNIKGLLLSIEATTINFKYGEFKFGLGGIIYKR